MRVPIVVAAVLLCVLDARAAAPAAMRAALAAPWVAVTAGPSIGGFTDPLEVTHAGDGSQRLFVVEQGGRVRVVAGGRVLKEPFLDAGALLGHVGGEQGLLGLAFHPKFKENGRLFIAYTDKAGDDAVAELHANADHTRAELPSLRVLIAVDDFASNHNGGNLAFGPGGKLYISTGDGGGAGDPKRNGLSRTSLLAKMLRVDVDALPAGTGPIADAQIERLWKGLRNPWRASFDRATGDMWIGDVGQDTWEEIDVVTRADLDKHLDFGWSTIEGAHCFRPAEGCDATGTEPPVFEYQHGDDGCSVTGGYVYRGTRAPQLAGSYVLGDFCSGRVWTVKSTPTGYVAARAWDSGIHMSSFGEDEGGEIWIVDYSGGAIRMLGGGPVTPSAALP